MWQAVTRRCWVELGGAVLSAVLLVATLVWPDWVELVFRVDPDGGNGTLERQIVIVTVAAWLTCSVLAGLEWRRAVLAMSAS